MRWWKAHTAPAGGHNPTENDVILTQATVYLTQIQERYFIEVNLFRYLVYISPKYKEGVKETNQEKKSKKSRFTRILG